MAGPGGGVERRAPESTQSWCPPMPGLHGQGGKAAAGITCMRCNVCCFGLRASFAFPSLLADAVRQVRCPVTPPESREREPSMPRPDPTRPDT
eukprot:1851900-Prymnesium_polylepis.1